jgi:hypothetical protein
VPLEAGLLEKLAGTYLTPSKATFQVLYHPGAGLSLAFPGEPHPTQGSAIQDSAIR